jgi:ferredoxin
MKIKCAVHYEDQIKSVSFDSKDSLMDGLRKAKIPIPFSCGGEGICTTCRLFIIKGDVSKRDSLEAERAIERGYKENERLSCQCFVLGSSIEVKLP